MNANDAIRDTILRYLYERHRQAKSPKAAGVGIRDLQAALRPSGIKQQQVGSNLDYLLQKGWAVEQVTNRTFTTPAGTTQMSEKRSYKISDTGIDRLEAASVYQREPTNGINVTTISGVTVLGDGNVVNTAFTDVSRLLIMLRQRVDESSAVNPRVRLEVTSDIDALMSQLQKPKPDRTLIKGLWTGIERSLTGAEFLELVHRIAQHFV